MLDLHTAAACATDIQVIVHQTRLMLGHLAAGAEPTMRAHLLVAAAAMECAGGKADCIVDSVKA